MKSFIETARHTARLAGRKVIQALPLSPDKKAQIKFLAVALASPLLGVRRSSPQTMIERLRSTGERYLTLSETACGAPRFVPDRSVSIIVPVYNQLSYTLRCLDSIKQHTQELDYEIVVVDDASSDRTQAKLSVRDDIVYIRNEKNLGFVGSCNAGGSRATKTYVCFLNNDTAVQPFWLSALIHSFQLYTNVGLAGSKLVFPDGRLQEAGGLVWEDGTAWNWGRLQDPCDPRYNYARHTDYCSGAAIVLPRALFDSLGGFDRHYTPAYAEDTDLAFKVRALGLATVYQPLSQVVHFEGITSGTDNSRGVKAYQVENLKKFARRWARVLTHQGRASDASLLCDRGIVGRILILDQITPEPDRDAGSVAQLEIIQAFRALGYKITFVPCSNFADMPPYTDMLSALGVESVLLPWTGSLERHLKAFGRSYDAVMIFRPPTWTAWIAKVREFAPQAKVIFHPCDLHFLRHQREADVTGSALQQKEAAKQAELDMIASADLCTLHSTVEKALVEAERPGTRVLIIPIVLEAQGRGKPMSEREGIVFLGGYRHPPNVDAVEYYLSEIHPLVEARLSEPVTFTAAGSFPPASLKGRDSAGVSIPGFIEDIAPLLHGARLMVAPLRYGAGVKGKILTALAHGLPVVTTSVGAEGLGDGGHLYVADSAESFADGVCHLYNDEKAWNDLHEAGYRHLRDNTSRAVAIRAVAEALSQLGLPYLTERVPASGAVCTFPEFGSADVFNDIGALVGAGSRALALRERPDLVLLPAGAKETKALSDGAGAVATLSAGGAHLQNAKSVVAVVDPTDSASVVALGADLRDRLRSDAVCAVVVAPHRLVASAAGYSVHRPFSGDPASTIELPYHEALAGAFGQLPGTPMWQFDTSLSGFPALSVLVLGRRSTAAWTYPMPSV